MSTDVAPCPFCGYKAVVVGLKTVSVMTTAVGCTNVHCGFTVQMNGSTENVIGMWNRLEAKA